MRKIDLQSAPVQTGSGYPSPFDAPCRLRQRLRLGDAAGLSQFGVNLLRLPPGSWSSQRHWHTAEDELVWILQGEVVLVTDQGEQILAAGDCAGFKAGSPDAHHLQNRTEREALVLEVGGRSPAQDAVIYPDIDLSLPGRAAGYRHKDGRPYPPKSVK